LDTDGRRDHAEENAVCYLQIILAQSLPNVGRERMCRDMDEWAIRSGWEVPRNGLIRMPRMRAIGDAARRARFAQPPHVCLPVAQVHVAPNPARRTVRNSWRAARDLDFSPPMCPPPLARTFGM